MRAARRRAGVEPAARATTIEARLVDVTLGGNPVLRGVDLWVGAGEWVALVGPNGSGKTTLLRALLGEVEATGWLRCGGIDPASPDRRRIARTVALVPQHPVIPPGMTVQDYVLLGRTPHLGFLVTEGARDHEVVGDTLARLDLDGFGHREVATLSGGERQRATLARALAQEPSVLLLDEPTSALDVGHQQQVLELVDSLRREHGLTVLSAMHDLTLASQYAVRLVLLSRGQAVAAGTAREVLTVDALAQHYGARVRVLHDECDGVVVVPVRDHQLPERP